MYPHQHFGGSTGYGHEESGGREALDQAFAEIFGAESAIVRAQVCHSLLLFLCLTGVICYLTNSHSIPVFLRYSCYHLCIVCFPKAWRWGKFVFPSPVLVLDWELIFVQMISCFRWIYYMFRLIICQLLAVAGAPYDTLEEVIGVRDSNGLGSLKDFGIDYREVPVCIGSSTTSKLSTCWDLYFSYRWFITEYYLYFSLLRMEDLIGKP